MFKGFRFFVGCLFWIFSFFFTCFEWVSSPSPLKKSIRSLKPCPYCQGHPQPPLTIKMGLSILSSTLSSCSPPKESHLAGLQGWLGWWSCHMGSSPSLTESISLRGLCSPLELPPSETLPPFPQWNQWPRISWYSGSPASRMMLLSISLFLAPALVAYEGKLGSKCQCNAQSPEEHICWPSSQVNHRDIRHHGRRFKSVW